MAPDRERSNSPMGRTPLPAMVMNVKMCCAKCEEKAKEECEEVEGVVKVVTDQSENKVIVYGMADPSALLKKMRRHLDKHAMYWPTDDANPVAPPLFPTVATREPPLYASDNQGIGGANGPPMHTVTVLPAADPRDKGPLADSREILHQRELQNAAAAESRERGAGRVGPPHNIVREVVFVDAKDGTPVDPRNVREFDPAAAPPRDGRNFGVDARDLVRPVERMELRGGEYPTRDPNHGLAQAQAPREVVVVPVQAVKDVDPRQVQHHPRDGHGPGELREVRRVHDPRDHPPAHKVHEVRPIGTGMRPVDVVNDQLRPIDPRNMRNPAPPREPGQDRGRVVVPEGLIPVRTGRDSREMHFAPATGPAGAGQYRSSGNDLSPRILRDAEYLSPRQHHAAPDRGPRSPRGDHAARDYYSGADHGQAPRSPRFEGPGADYGQAPRSPRFEGPGADYGQAPRSPRFEGPGTDYGQAPRSPRFVSPGAPRSPGRGRGGAGDDFDPRPRPVLDRELSFNEFGPGPAVDRGVRVPLPYEPRDAAAAVGSFDFHGPAGPALQHPLSPRSNRTDHMDQHGPQLVRGYGDIDPRQFRQAPADPLSTSPRGIRPVQRYNDIHPDAATMIRNRDDAMQPHDLYRSRGADGGPPLSPRSQHHGSQYYNSESLFRSPHDERGEVGGEYYEPKESYFSDYHPSQNYQPGPLATQDIDELTATNPLYKKQLLSDPGF